MDKNWVDLPQDLLEKICNLLISPDCITLQSVCKSWRATLKNISSRLRELPWLLMLPKDKEEDPDAFDFFSLSKQKIFTIRLPEMRGKSCCGSFQNGWLMTMDMDLNISLFHPWSKKSLQLPHQSTFKDPWSKNTLQLPHEFTFKDQNYVDEEGTYTYYTSEEVQDIRDMYIVKAALSDDANMVLVIYGCAGYSAYCRIGDKVWTEIVGITPMEDVIYHNGQFYALSSGIGLHLFHIEDGVKPWFERLTEDLLVSGLFYLAPDIFTDSMFVIIRIEGFLDAEDGEDENHTRHITTGREIFKTPLGDYVDAEDGEDENHTRHIRTRFAIYKTPLVEGVLNKKLKVVESLDDRILFLGFNSSMIVMASEFPGFKGNRIYFGGTRMEPCGCCHSGVYNVEDGTVENLFTDRFHPMSLPPLWIATPPYSFQRDFGEKLRMEGLLVST